ncbi:hypothetical protein CYMTET_29870 [Cymbomonas tetramitiformis]|uniref:Uncharacterized protein n=1 Tax=Cymbomonas tetramitiformis TaxID=36881 RepID=A0AAE0KUR0_9CHLO|nr:hypothetical protein CYMTET_29870 [Cymbomonas tetramitiformis]
MRTTIMSQQQPQPQHEHQHQQQHPPLQQKQPQHQQQQCPLHLQPQIDYETPPEQTPHEVVDLAEVLKKNVKKLQGTVKNKKESELLAGAKKAKLSTEKEAKDAEEKKTEAKLAEAKRAAKMAVAELAEEEKQRHVKVVEDLRTKMEQQDYIRRGV